MNKQKLMGILLLSLVILISMVSFEVTETWMFTIMICAVAPVCMLIYDKFINQNKRVVHYLGCHR
ncbi:hypothetical protein [Enterococcus sp. DIV0756]|uniref:hypothetical protein n=1 Tax=Enterococcus sp. DIV0756 TaxID=2774636 RepID=UPI003F688687